MSLPTAASGFVRAASRRHFFRPISSSAAAACASSPATTPTASPSAEESVYDRSAANAVHFDTTNSYARTSSNRIYQSPLRTPMKPHAQSPQRTVPTKLNIPRPGYARTGVVLPSLFPSHVLLHDDTSITRMRTAAKLARKVLDVACSLAKPGVTTESIDQSVHAAILRHGAYPSPLNYSGFPKSVCSSVNEVICHGIPDERELRLGDVVSFDVSCFVGGVHGDNCATVIVGDEEDGMDKEEGVDNDNKKNGGTTDWRGVPQRTTFANDQEEELFITGRRLVQASLEALNEGVAVCRPGANLADIGRAIHDVCDAYGYDTVRKYRGHGIGEEFHCAPFVKHYRNDDDLTLEPGMIFTIEPMLTEGSSDCYEWSDAWTVVTVDGGRASQFEHTVLITDDGVEILTVPE